MFKEWMMGGWDGGCDTTLEIAKHSECSVMIIK
jgi:hypothetical protein